MTTSYTDIAAAAKQALLDILTNKIASYELNGVRYSYHNIDELRKVISAIEPLAAQESGDRSAIILADFGGAS